MRHQWNFHVLWLVATGCSSSCCCSSVATATTSSPLSMQFMRTSRHNARFRSSRRCLMSFSKTRPTSSDNERCASLRSAFCAPFVSFVFFICCVAFSLILHVHSSATFRVSGNDSVNLVIAWQGKAEERYYQVASTGYLTTEQCVDVLGFKKTDPGWFGDGIYFTQWPRFVFMFSPFFSSYSRQCTLFDQLRRRIFVIQGGEEAVHVVCVHGSRVAGR